MEQGLVFITLCYLGGELFWDVPYCNIFTFVCEGLFGLVYCCLTALSA